MSQEEEKRIRELESFDLNNGYPKEQLQSIIKLASNICDTPVSLIDIIDEFNQRTIVTHGDWEEKVIPRNKSICDRVVVNDDLLIIDDVRENKQISSRLSEEVKSKIRFFAGAPIRTSNGYSLGALCVIDSIPRNLNNFQKESLKTLADEVMARLQLSKQSKLLTIKNGRLENYATFLKNSADILCIIDSKTQLIVDVNDTQSMLGFDKSELVGKKFIHFIKSDQISMTKIDEWFKQNSKSENRLSIPIQLTHKDGDIKWFRCNITSKDEQWFLTARDITKQKLAEDKVQNLQKKFEQIAHASSDIIWELDVKNNELIWSEDITELFGYPQSDRLVTFDWWLNKVHPDDRRRVIEDFNTIKSSNKNHWSSYYRFKTFTGEYRYVFDNAYFERNEDGEIQYIVGAMADLTDLKKAELRQQNLLTRIQHANHIAKLGYWEFDLNDESVFWSDEMYHILDAEKSTTKPSIDYILDSVTPAVSKKIAALIDRIEKKKTIGELEHKIMLSDQKKKYLSHRGQLKYNENGEPVAVVITTQDITKRKEIEVNLSKSLKQKEILLSEIHHRVKNNLAIISGLLELELYHRGDHDEKISSFIRKSQMRIISIAKIHELLYQSESYTHVSFKEYINTLLIKIESAFNSEQKEVEFNTQIDELKLNINQAIPCGLILNELISNAVKHAFTGKNHGMINVSFTESDNLIEMNVSDNGSGFPTDFDLKKHKNLGFTLVEIQTIQLGGQLKIESENGISCKITFKKKDEKGSSSGFVKKTK